MPRTTLDIDGPVLEELKRLRERTGKSLGQVASELLARALAGEDGASRVREHSFAWHAQPMRALVDVRDKDALDAVLLADEESSKTRSTPAAPVGRKRKR